MGAWIETTFSTRAFDKISESHPVWVRGLKPICIVQYQKVITVAPRVGAWIETKVTFELKNFAVPHPVWVRGLKP